MIRLIGKKLSTEACNQTSTIRCLILDTSQSDVRKNIVKSKQYEKMLKPRVTHACPTILFIKFHIFFSNLWNVIITFFIAFFRS